MHIVLLCATSRGLRFLESLRALTPDDNVTVVSFREDPAEPPFLDAIRSVASTTGSEFIEARSVASPEVRRRWSSPVDLLIAVSWRYLVPRDVYERSTRGSYVFHDSLLPEYRGFSPTVWAMANGADHTGVTLFRMDESVDTGDIVDQERVEIGPDETISIVLERVTETYLRMLRRDLPLLKAGTAPRRPQRHADATTMRKRTPDDDRIDWNRPTSETYNLIRAITQPYRGAFTSADGRRIRVWEALRDLGPRPSSAVPGTVVSVRPGLGVVVATADGLLLVTKVQTEGGEIVTADRLIETGDAVLGP